jgi:hypothetical protein
MVKLDWWISGSIVDTREGWLSIMKQRFEVGVDGASRT